jgi:sirohydrochlorin ferrochelatase
MHAQRARGMHAQRARGGAAARAAPPPAAAAAAAGRRATPAAWRRPARRRAPERQLATAAAAPDAQSSLGVVIVDHGSKRAASNDALLEFVALYRAATGRANVQPAHMELAPPSVGAAVAACVAAGAARVVVAPYFLSRGRHIQEDVPALVAEAAAAHPGVEVVLAEPVGVDPLMATLLESRVRAALAAAEGGA